MAGRRYARIQNGRVAELIDVPEGVAIEDMFHASLLPSMVECTGLKVDCAPDDPGAQIYTKADGSTSARTDVRQRMTWDGQAFGAEPAPPPPPPEDILAASDRRAARKLEDLLDALLAKGVIAPADLPDETRAWLAERKDVRGRL